MIDFRKDYILENKTVKLAPLAKNDVQHLLQYAIHEPELWNYSLIQANSPENLKMYIEKAIKERENEKSYAFSVFDKRTNKYAGSTRFYDIQNENSTLQIGFTWYGKDFQGSGLNKNCKFLLLSFAFEILQMERVEFRADSENHKSINAMKSIGCKIEGILRSNMFKPDGSRRDSIVLSILKIEWEQTVKDTLATCINI